MRFSKIYVRDARYFLQKRQECRFPFVRLLRIRCVCVPATFATGTLFYHK